MGFSYLIKYVLHFSIPNTLNVVNCYINRSSWGPWTSMPSPYSQSPLSFSLLSESTFCGAVYFPPTSFSAPPCGSPPLTPLRTPWHFIQWTFLWSHFPWHPSSVTLALRKPHSPGSPPASPAARSQPFLLCSPYQGRRPQGWPGACSLFSLLP